MEILTHDPEHEQSTISNEELAKAQSEAYGINDELDQLLASDTFKNAESVNKNELVADIIEDTIHERTKLVHESLRQNPELAEIIQNTYIREREVTEFPIFKDPNLTDIEKKSLQQLEYYFTHQRYLSDLNRLNQILPDSYQKANPDKLPPVFIHDKKRVDQMPCTASEAAAFAYNGPNSNIHIIASDQLRDQLCDYRSNYLHELVHTTENHEETHLSIALQEGIAHSIECNMTDRDVHLGFINRIKNRQTNSKDNLQQFFDNKNFIFDFEKATIQRPTMAEKRQQTDTWRYNEITRDYYMLGSFIQWYRDNYDPKLTLINQNSPNRKFIKTKLVQLYPTYLRNQETGAIVDTDERGYPTDDVKVTPTNSLPDEFQDFHHEWFDLAYADDDPDLLEAIQEINKINSSQGGFINAQEYYPVFQNLVQNISNRVESIQEEYSHFINLKLLKAKYSK